MGFTYLFILMHSMLLQIDEAGNSLSSCYYLLRGAPIHASLLWNQSDQFGGSDAAVST